MADSLADKARTALEGGSNPGSTLADLAYSSVSSGGGGGGGGLWTEIAREELASSAASIQFAEAVAGDWSDYKALRISAYGLIGTAGFSRASIRAIDIQFNGDTGTNYGDAYARLRVHGDGSTFDEIGGAWGKTGGEVGNYPDKTDNTTVSGWFIVDMSNISGQDTLVRSVGAVTTDDIEAYSFSRFVQWENTALIDQIDLIPASADFDSGAVFILEGLS